MNRRIVWVLTTGRVVRLSLRRLFRSARTTTRRVKQRHAYQSALAILRALVNGHRVGRVGA